MGELIFVQKYLFITCVKFELMITIYIDLNITSLHHRKPRKSFTDLLYTDQAE